MADFREFSWCSRPRTSLSVPSVQSIIDYARVAVVHSLVMVVTYTADQLRAFNRDVDVSVARPARKATFSPRLWQPLPQRKHKQDQLLRQPIVVSLKGTDDLTIGSVNARSIGNKATPICQAISYENLDILVIIIIYNFHWRL